VIRPAAGAGSPESKGKAHRLLSFGRRPQAPAPRRTSGQAVVLLRLLPGLLVAVAAFAVAVPHIDARNRQRDGEGAALLEQARVAALEGDYAGTVQVEWQTPAGTRTAQVHVRNADGVLYVDGERDLVAADSQRYVEGAGGWALAYGTEGAAELPDPTDNWDFRVVRGPLIAGTPTRVVEIIDRDTGEVRQRVYMEPGSFVVRREILDENGDPYRVVEFVEFTAVGKAPAVPDDYEESEPDEAAELPGDVPEEVGDGFELVNAYELDNGVTQLFYSDGLFAVSVFVDEGELDTGGLPSGATTREIEGEEVRAYATPTGDVLVWEDDDDRVVAWVSDAPPDEMAGVAASFTDDDDPGFWGRAADVVLDPFSWG
jgi:negative regulator of sigma E activity